MFGYLLVVAPLSFPNFSYAAEDEEESTSSRASEDEAAAEAAGDAAAAALVDFLGRVENLAAVQDSANLGQEGPDTLAHARDMVTDSAQEAAGAISRYAESVSDALRLTPEQLAEQLSQPALPANGELIPFDDSVPTSNSNEIALSTETVRGSSSQYGLSPTGVSPRRVPYRKPASASIMIRSGSIRSGSGQIAPAINTKAGRIFIPIRPSGTFER